MKRWKGEKILESKIVHNSLKIYHGMACATIERKVQHAPDGNRDQGCIVQHLFQCGTLVATPATPAGSWLNFSVRLSPDFIVPSIIGSSFRFDIWCDCRKAMRGCSVVQLFSNNADLIKILASTLFATDLAKAILVIVSTFHPEHSFFFIFMIVLKIWIIEYYMKKFLFL